jgi:hypothetical protein
LYFQWCHTAAKSVFTGNLGKTKNHSSVVKIIAFIESVTKSSGRVRVVSPPTLRMWPRTGNLGWGSFMSPIQWIHWKTADWDPDKKNAQLLSIALEQSNKHSQFVFIDCSFLVCFWLGRWFDWSKWVAVITSLPPTCSPSFQFLFVGGGGGGGCKKKFKVTKLKKKKMDFRKKKLK